MKYVVSITETLGRTVIVDAQNKVDAERKVEQAYDNGNIVLDYDNFQEYEVFVHDEASDYDIKLYEEIETEVE